MGGAVGGGFDSFDFPGFRNSKAFRNLRFQGLAETEPLKACARLFWVGILLKIPGQVCFGIFQDISLRNIKKHFLSIGYKERRKKGAFFLVVINPQGCVPAGR